MENDDVTVNPSQLLLPIFKFWDLLPFLQEVLTEMGEDVIIETEYMAYGRLPIMVARLRTEVWQRLINEQPYFLSALLSWAHFGEHTAVRLAVFDALKFIEFVHDFHNRKRYDAGAEYIKKVMVHDPWHFSYFS